MRCYGAPQHVLDEMAAAYALRRKETEVLVWPEHWHAVSLLRLMATQWRSVVFNGHLRRTGLDYGALGPALAATRHIAHRQPMERLLPQLQALEVAVINFESAGQ